MRSAWLTLITVNIDEKQHIETDNALLSRFWTIFRIVIFYLYDYLIYFRYGLRVIKEQRSGRLERRPQQVSSCEFATCIVLRGDRACHFRPR